MAKIGFTRFLCSQDRVTFYFSVRHTPRTQSDWPTPATTRRWPHFRRLYPVLATQLPKGTQYTPLPENGRAVRPHRPNGPPRTICEFHPSSSLCYRRRRTRTICLMYGSPGHKPPRPLSLSPTNSHTPQYSALSPSNQKPPQHSSSIYHSGQKYRWRWEKPKYRLCCAFTRLAP